MNNGSVLIDQHDIIDYKALVDEYIEGRPDTMSKLDWAYRQLYILQQVYLNDKEQELRLERYEGDGIYMILQHQREWIKELENEK